MHKICLTALAVTLATGHCSAQERGDIVDTAVAANQFKTLVAAVRTADLVETLKGDGPFTVFAPTDDAFAKLPEGTVEGLLKPENRDQLVSILTYHVVPGRVLAKDVVELDRAKTVEGSNVRIGAGPEGVKINESLLLKADILCSNGVIHVIDSVLMPPPKPLKAAKAREMLEHAVNRGAHLFNAGHHGRCADIYASTMETLSTRGIEGCCESTQRMMTTLVRRAGRESHATRRAWMLRHGIDAMDLHLSRQMSLTLGR